MNKLTALTVSTLVLLCAVPQKVTQAQNGWDPVKAAHIVGAANWCAGNVVEDKTAYEQMSLKVSRILAPMIEAGKITSTEASLITDRVKEQRNYLGRSLHPSECENLAATVANVQPWQLVTSVEGRFSVEMPSLPNREDTANKIQGQEFEWIEYEALIEPVANPLLDKPEYYLVAHTQLPQSYQASKSNDEIFDAFGEYIFKEMGLPELKNNEREITPDGVPARLTSGEGFGQSIATIMYIVDDRFYLNLVVSQKREHFERFLRSFEALDLPDRSATLPETSQ